MATSRRIFFIANGVFGKQVAGGDIHFLEMARALLRKGFEVHFVGGHVLQEILAFWQLPVFFHPSEKKIQTGLTDGNFLGQLQLLWVYFKRGWNTLRVLKREIGTEDGVYAVSDYWFDVWPVVQCRAKYKIGVWHMECPSFKEILFRRRADVSFLRLPSLHYWLSQTLSLHWLQNCTYKKLFYLHPAMKLKLLALGYQADEISPISYGVDVSTAQKVSETKKEYDVVWLGRLHRQKGVDDIIPTLKYLAQRLENFKAVIMGKVKEGLQPLIGKDLTDKVFFPGFVSEEEKFRLLKASRVFLMPSRHEGSPRVIGEALLCGTRVVAYEVETYPAVFHDWIHYVPQFDLVAFQKEIEKQVIQSRNQEQQNHSFNLTQFEKEHSWQATGDHFVAEVQILLAKA